ncbi:DNA-3-methyladenine glycosylase [Paenibacillus sp. FSL R7-0331]|uniref:DNA-3-methyladenine glycosylase n=1 Tax=Paenibacillus sp. FSL R7-0331 TaxID=1536773 RepID=UPI0004F75039|nr:DNA-3-methyladenine glycosylase [Paenibacillus sp. FSL R7-0331]AIQ50189.1 3-methyladenine DNA glycosylase [Paenibacillus sp. FSL R7-0331]
MNHNENKPVNKRLIGSELYSLPALQAAPLLLGRHLVRSTEDGEIRCRIVETESYGGAEDKGSHAFGGRRTARTDVMFREGGTIYIYLIYGMYHCLNIVTAGEGDPHAVLIRAVEPLTAADAGFMRSYRGTAGSTPRGLSGGPGKLCRAMQIDKRLNGLRLDSAGSPLRLEQGEEPESLDIVQSPRINIPYAEEYAPLPWRFYLRNNPYVSVKDKLEQPFIWS